MVVLIGIVATLAGILSIFMPMIGLIFSFLLLPLIGVLCLYALFAAWKVYSGEDFKYIVIGPMLKK